MSNEKQTAVDWVFNEIILAYVAKGNLSFIDVGNIKEQAKEIEKEQIKDAWIDDRFPLDKDWVKQCAEEYYNETYGAKK
jgi:hypothetical protein